MSGLPVAASMYRGRSTPAMEATALQLVVTGARAQDTGPGGHEASGHGAVASQVARVVAVVRSRTRPGRATRTRPPPLVQSKVGPGRGQLGVHLTVGRRKPIPGKGRRPRKELRQNRSRVQRRMETFSWMLKLTRPET